MVASDCPSPTIVHVTHWKAGSQWIHRILIACVPDLVVTPRVDQSQFLNATLLTGRVYPTVYVTRDEYATAKASPSTKRFIVIRDLRDTLVSAYFSIKLSHPVLMDEHLRLRASLHTKSLEDGLLYLLNVWLHFCADIQRSWLGAPDQMIRYEDLLDNDHEILERVLIDQCRLPVNRDRLHAVITANRFEALTGGRRRGQENQMAHERKGIAQDWRNYFSDAVKDTFKACYGELLVATGYEPDSSW